MIDVVSKATRSRMMAGIRGKDTHPEMIVRSYLHRHGFRYRLHLRNLPGKPDLVLPKYDLVILVHGCFWHRHSNCAKASTPTSNIDAWSKKFLENIERDRKILRKLRSAGWRVFVIWECGLKTNSEENLSWLPLAIKNYDQQYIEWPNISL